MQASAKHMPNAEKQGISADKFVLFRDAAPVAAQ
jgi:hypothetical protein